MVLEKELKVVARSQPTNVATTDSSNVQESTTAPPGSRGKDKTTKETGKTTGKDGQTGGKPKGPRPSIKSSVTAENVNEEKRCR